MTLTTQERGIYFGPERFKKFHNSATTYAFSPRGGLANNLDRLLDHAFIADRACVWDPRLEGHELAVIARTYCSDEEIDSARYPGLRCVRLAKKFLGPGEPGTPIAALVDRATRTAEAVLSSATGIPADMLAYMLSLDMIHRGYQVVLDASNGSNFPNALIRKVTAISRGPFTTKIKVRVLHEELAHRVTTVKPEVCGFFTTSGSSRVCVTEFGIHCPFFRSIAPIFCDPEETINPHTGYCFTNNFAYCDHHDTDGDCIESSTVLLSDSISNAPASIDESTINEITYSILDRLQPAIKEAIAQEIHSALSPSNQA